LAVPTMSMPNQERSLATEASPRTLRPPQMGVPPGSMDDAQFPSSANVPSKFATATSAPLSRGKNRRSAASSRMIPCVNKQSPSRTARNGAAPDDAVAKPQRQVAPIADAEAAAVSNALRFSMGGVDLAFSVTVAPIALAKVRSRSPNIARRPLRTPTHPARIAGSSVRESYRCARYYAHAPPIVWRGCETGLDR
jgi:hypothetical protein